MQTLYVNITGAGRGRVSWPDAMMWSLVLYLLINMLLMAPFAILHELSSKPEFERWRPPILLGIAVVAVFIPLAWTLLWRHLRKPSVQIDAYGKSSREIGRAVTAYQRKLEHTAGRPYLRRLIKIGLILAAALTLLVVAGQLEGSPLDLWRPVLVLLGFLFAWKSIRMRRARNRSVGDAAKSWVYLLVSWVADALNMIILFGSFFALLFYMVWVECLIRGEPIPDWPQLPWWLALTVGIVGLPVVGWLLLRLFLFSYDLSGRLKTKSMSLVLPRVSDLRARDPRKPVVLLRSFQDDARWVNYTRLARGHETGSSTLEDAIARTMARYGPFIAIAEPGTDPEPGAAKEFAVGES